jgi:hypothetical protein
MDPVTVMASIGPVGAVAIQGDCPQWESHSIQLIDISGRHGGLPLQFSRNALFAEQAIVQRLADFPQRLLNSFNVKPTVRVFGLAWDERLAWATGYGGGDGEGKRSHMHEVQWNGPAFEENADITSTEFGKRTVSATRYAARVTAYKDSLLSPHDRMMRMAKDLQKAYAESPDQAASMIRDIMDEGQRRGIRLLVEMIKAPEEGGGIEADQHDLRRMVWNAAMAASFSREDVNHTYMHRKRKAHGGLSEDEAALPLLPWDAKAIARLGHFLVKGWLPEEARLWVGRYLGQLPRFAKNNYTLEMRGVWPSYCWSEDLFAADEFLPIKEIHFAERRYPTIGVHTGTILQETFAKLDNVIVTAVVNPLGFIKLGGGRPGLTGFVRKGISLPWAALDPKKYAYARVELFIKDGLVCFCRVVDTGEILYFTRVWHKTKGRYVTSYYGDLSEKEFRTKRMYSRDYELHPYTAEMFEEDQRLASEIERKQDRFPEPSTARTAGRADSTLTPFSLPESVPDWARGWKVRLRKGSKLVDPLGYQADSVFVLFTPDGKEYQTGGTVYDGRIAIRILALSWQYGLIPKLVGETVYPDDEPAGRTVVISGFGVSLLGLTPFDKPRPDFRKKEKLRKPHDPFWSDVELSLFSNPSYRRIWAGMESLWLGAFVGVPLVLLGRSLGLFGGHLNFMLAFIFTDLAALGGLIYHWLFPAAHAFRWGILAPEFFSSGTFDRTYAAVRQLEKVFYGTFLAIGALSYWRHGDLWIPLVALDAAIVLVVVAHYVNDWIYQWAHPEKGLKAPPLTPGALALLHKAFHGIFGADLGPADLSLRLPWHRSVNTIPRSTRQSA